MSELNPEQIQAEPATVAAGSSVPASGVSQEMAPFGASEAGRVDAPTIAPDHETMPKPEAPKIDAAKIDANRIASTQLEPVRIDRIERSRLDADAIKAGAANADRLKAESFKPNASGVIGRLLIMSP
ncbi:MAG: hypothetical protein WCB02_33890, partial [Bradyrhizobium sp.]